MPEIELKLAVEGPFAPELTPERTDVAGMEQLSPLDLRATYYDTADLRLARHGITLRYRTGEEDRGRWTLKLPAEPGDHTARSELHFDAPGSDVPAQALDLVTAFARSAPLAPVARLRTSRRRWSLRGGAGEELAELVDDRVSVLQHGRVVERFREVEIEGRKLDRPGLERIARVLAEDGATVVPAVPKLIRALGERAGAPPDVVVPHDLSPSDPAGTAVRAAIARSVERIVRNDPGTRLGEVESLHQMRVGARRLRSDLRTFGGLVDPGCADGLREELRWLGAVLGAVRDLDVMRAGLRARAGRLETDLEPLFESLEARRSAARGSLLTALRSERFVGLLDRLVEAAANPPLGPGAERPGSEVLPPLVAGAWRKLAKAGRRLEQSSPDEDYHRVRVEAKRARYAAEAVAPALGAKRERAAKRFARRAAGVQEVLGALQDTVVAREAIAETVGRYPRAGAFNLAAGRMLEREEQARRDARAAFPDTWRKLDRPGLGGWMKR